jgi:hypothetical protein
MPRSDRPNRLFLRIKEEALCVPFDVTSKNIEPTTISATCCNGMKVG